MPGIIRFLVLSSMIFFDVANAGRLNQTEFTPTDDEFRSLPPFCWAKMKTPSGGSEYKSWESVLGPDFIHVHHYCAGVNFASRCRKFTDKINKDYACGGAVKNFEYMINHAKPDFSLMSDVYYQKGVVLAFLNKDALALMDLEKSIEVNPKNTAAYLSVADLYVKIRQDAKALSKVSEGLRYVPESKGLRKKYIKLGGELPYPESVNPVVAEKKEGLPPAANSNSSQDVVEIKKAHSEYEVKEQAKTTSGLSTPEAGSSPTNPSDQSVNSVAGQGNATNPWCRFCPDIPPEK